jgi:hypothetical protein
MAKPEQEPERSIWPWVLLALLLLASLALFFVYQPRGTAAHPSAVASTHR